MKRSWLLLLAAGCTPASDRPLDTDTDTEVAIDSAGVGGSVFAGDDVEIAVGTPLTLTGNVTGAIASASWDLGDGARADGTQVTHTYDAPGNQVASFTVVFADGRRLTDTVRVTAYLPAASPRPVAASTVAVDDVHGRVWVAVPEADHVVAIDTSTHAATMVPVCHRPRTVALSGDVLAVTCENDDALALLDVSGTLDGIVPTVVALGRGTRPYAVVPRGTGWAVSAQGTGEVVYVTGAEHDVTSVDVGPDPRALAVDAAGEPFATRFRAAGDVAHVLTGGAPIVLAHDPGPDSDTGNRGVPTVLRALAITPDGATLFVGGTLANIDRGTLREGQALSFESTLRATLRVVHDGVEDFEARKQLDNHGDVSALALSPRGNWLWMAHMGTGTLTRLDAYTQRAAGVILDAGHGVDGLALSSDGRTLFVHAWLDRELRAYDVSDPSVANPAVAWSAPTVTTEPLTAQVLAGKVLFHDAGDRRLARDGYVSCAACHPDGRDDGIIWDFTNRGEGLRNTITLEGRSGTAMGPVHWTGNFDEIQDFEGDIRNAQGGTGLLTDADWAEAGASLGPHKAGRADDLDALAAYVASLSTTPTSPFDAPAEGAALFAARGCDVCHAPPLYTDSAIDVRHDIGTVDAAAGQRLGGPLDGFDTPTLLGVHATAPYLHDGAASTVEAAIAAHDAAHTGVALSVDDIDTLAAFVRSL